MSPHRVVACAAVTLAASVALSPSPAAAKPRACGKLVRPSLIVKVIAIRGVSCRTARHVATIYATADAPKPWKCDIGTGQKYAGAEIAAMCGYGGHGSLLRRPHAFVTVQLHQAG